MEENKIKAQKLFEKGMKFYNSQNYEEALKLFEKSQNLNYNNIVETFISQCKNNLKNNKNFNENFNNKNYNENFSNKNFSNENKNFSNENKNFSNENKNFSNENKNFNNFSNENNNNNNFNKNDDEICTNLLKLKDYYEILKISKSASKDEIKRAYKKQAIKFHPDKNKSSKAEECFKKISEAYQILSNDEKRNFYDKFGTEEEFRQKYQSQHQNFEEEMDPFDIFDILFNGPEGFQRRRNFRRNNNYYQRETQNNNVQRNKFAVFIQFLPLIFLLLVNILPDLLKSSPLYQFTNDSYYLNKRKTSKNNVVYFVGDKFLKKYPKIKDVFESGIENEIERNYLNYVAEKCEEVLHTKQILEYRIRLGYRYFQNELNRLDFRSCERYNDLRYKIR